MTDVNQDFSGPELESIINNASEKSITASAEWWYERYYYYPPDAWPIIVVISYAGVVVVELFRFIQTRNMLHLVLVVPAGAVAIAYILMWDGFVHYQSLYKWVPYVFLAVNWITIITSIHLLSI
jgi:hypothetical protein